MIGKPNHLSSVPYLIYYTLDCFPEYMRSWLPEKQIIFPAWTLRIKVL